MQRAQAIELLENLPDVMVSPAVIESMSDAELFQWLYELGYDWDGYEWVLEE